MFVDEERKLPINGTDHWVRLAGAAHGGRPLILVHGGPGGNAYMLEKSIGPLLAKELTVVYYDQRGCGRSGHAAQYSMPLLIDDLDRLATVLGMGSFALAGFSFGGWLAAEYAVAHPDRVERLVLGAPAIDPVLRCAGRFAAMDAVADDEFRARIRSVAAEIIHKPGGISWSDIWPLWQEMNSETGARFRFADPANVSLVQSLPAALGASDPAFGISVMASERDRPLLDDLAGLQIPTQVLVGLYDRNVGVDACRDIVDRMPDAQLALLDRSGHNTWEQPELYAELIRGFLKSS